MQKQLSKLNDHSPAHAKLKDAKFYELLMPLTASFSVSVTRKVVQSNEL
jgi:hypothetical protein